MSKRIFALAASLWLALCLCVSVCAQEVPDLSRKGRIRVTMSHGGKPVGGGSLTVYRVGEIVEEDGNYRFRTTDTFSQFQGNLNAPQSSDLAGRLCDFVESENILGTTQRISDQGYVEFSDLQPGLYLLVQEQTAAGYSACAPFLVSLPKYTDGAYLYDVDASPKTQLTPTPTEPKPDDPKLPQTGQLNWPIPVMTVAGLLLMVIGVMLLRRKKSV